MKLSGKRLQVHHYAQMPCEPFRVDVKDEHEAYKIAETLANQHLFLFAQKIIPDYANIIAVVMYDDKEQDWVDYYNENEQMDWDEFNETYLQSVTV